MVRGDAIRDRQDWLSTGQAAKYCSVKPDTILKWIKRGKVPAERTAGGHYRIQRKDLEPLALVPQPADEAGAPGRPRGQPLRCWEYLGHGDGVPEQCEDCIVLRSRAAWCFQLAEHARDLGHAQRFCAESCEECAYYQRVRGMATRVLVITDDDAFRDHLLGTDEPTIRLRFADNAYGASAVIHEFRPTFVVVDHDLLKENGGATLLDHLLEDSRVPGVRVVLAVTRGRAARVRAAVRRDVVVGVIEKPFGGDRIASVVDAFPVEHGALDEESG